MSGERFAWGISISSFVGRDQEIVELERLLADRRLVTVIGPPGVGKTRLAIEVAHRRRDPVLGCDLAEASRALDVHRSLSNALGAPLCERERPAQDVLGAVVAARGALLLVLDNADDIVDIAAGVLIPLLAMAPLLRMLVTSRRRLRIDGEALFEVQPLAIGDGRGSRDAPAVRLFVDRARAVRPAISVGDAEVGLIHRICEVADGLPLAIEHAAARTRTLSLEQLAAEVLGLARTAEPIARGLEGSYRALQPWVRSALAQAAVFASGFDRSAAHAVIELDPGASVDEALEQLCDRSLVSAYEPRPGALRFRLLASVREFARGKLGAGEPQVMMRHARHYCRQGVAFAEALTETHAPAARAWLIDESDNLLQVHRRFAGAADGALHVGASAFALGALLSFRGPVELYDDLLTTALARVGPGLPLLRAKLLSARARARRWEAAPVDSLRDHDEAILLARIAGDPRWLGRLVIASAVTRARTGDFAAAYEAAHSGLAVCRSVHDAWGIACGEAVMAYGRLLSGHGDARAAHELALRAARRAGDTWLEAVLLGNLGTIAQEAGEHDAAVAGYRAALGLLHDIEARRFAAEVEISLGTAYHERGRFEDALAAHGRARTTLLALGAGVAAASAAAIAGMAQAALGQIDDARATIATAQRTLDASQDRTLSCLGRLCLIYAELSGVVREPRTRIRSAVRQTIAQVFGSPRAKGFVPHVRWALRCIDAAVERTGSSAGITVAVDGSAIQLDGAAAVRVDRRPMRRLLAALARQLACGQGAALGDAELVELAWPGERMLDASARNRLHSAVSMLRALGLSSALQRSGDGYALDPSRVRILKSDLPRRAT